MFGILIQLRCASVLGIWNRTSTRTMSFMILLGTAIISLLQTTFVIANKGETRCYCNEASCVRTGYMCKSALGTCFSQLSQDSATIRSVHGCAEVLPEVDRDACASEDRKLTVHGSSDWPLLLCCRQDMCNYMDSGMLNNYISRHLNSTISSSGEKVAPSGSERDHPVHYGFPDESTLQREIWFRVAVIAVPIVGAFVLVMLVIIAVRMLRSDRHFRSTRCRHFRRPLITTTPSTTTAAGGVAAHLCPVHDAVQLVHEHCCDCSKMVLRPHGLRVVSVHGAKHGHGYEKIHPENCAAPTPALIVVQRHSQEGAPIADV